MISGPGTEHKCMIPIGMMLGILFGMAQEMTFICGREGDPAQDTPTLRFIGH